MSQHQRDARLQHYLDAVVQPINVQAFDYNEDRGDWITLLMGPTGAGKSKFIEAFAGNDTLGISKDQLDSVTQTITTYEVISQSAWNGPGTEVVWIGREYERSPNEPRVYIVDTPGFSDSQISELEIVQMMREWMKIHGCRKIDSIFYLYSIMGTRLPGSKRRSIEMLKSLCGVNTTHPGSLLVITTMWDKLWNETSKAAAEQRYQQLRDDIWKDLLEAGGTLTKFMNTHESAADIIQKSILRGASPSVSQVAHYVAFDLEIETTNLRETPYSLRLYQDLIDRIQNARQQKQMLELELEDPEVQINEALKSITQQRLQMNERLLEKFARQLVEFGDPPDGFEDVVRIRKASIDEHERRAVQETALPTHDTDHDATIPHQNQSKVGTSGTSKSSKFKTLLDGASVPSRKGSKSSHHWGLSAIPHIPI